MLAALDTIVSFFKTIIGFIVMVIQNIITFITNIPVYLNFALSLVNIIPPFIRWFMIAAVMFIVIDTIIRKVRGNE